MPSWVLWIDYHCRDRDGFTHSNVRNARADLDMTPGRSSSWAMRRPTKRSPRSFGSTTMASCSCALLPGSVDDNRLLFAIVPKR